MKAKKSFGQHFLNTPSIAQRIAGQLQLTGAYDLVMEIGPGKGMLTQFLLYQPYQLMAIEADRDMIPYLKSQFPTLSSHLVLADFLQVDLPALSGGRPFAVIGNFPYNISSQILLKVVENRHLVPEMVGMFQREVAERVVAPPGNKVYGVISVLVQAFYEGQVVLRVDKGSFSPPPNVQSAVIRLVRKANTDLGCDEKLFRTIVKQAFGQRRKMLRNTLKGLLPDALLTQEAQFSQRPEQLSVADFVALTNLAQAHHNSTKMEDQGD